MPYSIYTDGDGCVYITRDGAPVSASDVQRALNTHDALVEALEGYVNLLEKVGDVMLKNIQPPTCFDGWCIDQLHGITDNAEVVRLEREARAALALAKENSR